MQTDQRTTDPRTTDWRRRTRFRLDARGIAIVDAEIVTSAATGLGVALSRPQALRVLAVRAVRCRCGVALRALPPLEAETRAGPVRVVDGDDLVAALVTTERQKLADEGPCVRLNRHQVLRVLLVRAARCACSIEGRVGVAR